MRRTRTYNPSTLVIRYDALISERSSLAADNILLAFSMAKKWRYKFSTLTEDERKSGCLEGLCKAAKKYKPESGFAFSTYATTAMYTTLLSMVEHNGRFKAALSDDLSEAVDPVVPEDFELFEKVDELPVVYRAVVRQTYFELLPEKSIARLHGESLKWVRLRLAEAIDQLRAAYGSASDEGPHRDETKTPRRRGKATEQQGQTRDEFPEPLESDVPDVAGAGERTQIPRDAPLAVRRGMAKAQDRC